MSMFMLNYNELYSSVVCVASILHITGDCYVTQHVAEHNYIVVN